jgi:hypothetical protein
MLGIGYSLISFLLKINDYVKTSCPFGEERLTCLCSQHTNDIRAW